MIVSRPLAAFLLVAATALAASPAAAQGRNCTAFRQAVSVRQVMTDDYLWYREVPDLKLTAYPTPEAYLDAARHRPLDQAFSYITTRAANDAFYSDSQVIAFGFSYSFTGGEMRVTHLLPGSPAQEAGLVRGARILEINGRTVADLARTGEIGTALGPATAGVAAELLFTRDGTATRGRMIKRLISIPTVSDTRVINVDGRRVGYIFFRNFVEPSIAALDGAFAELRAAQVTELVLDLRYNGGGLVTVAQHLASLIGGARTSGQVFTEFFHNDRNAARNRVIRFTRPAEALTLDRVVIVATRASASASELVINSLRPFMPVWIVGDRTYGKPVGQYSTPFCDKVLAAVSFTLRNADGYGDFFEGLQPDCRAGDDVEHQLGDPGEGSLREALTVIATGGCSAAGSQGASAASAAPLASPGPAPGESPATGWQALIGVH
jgi:C-terminal processing protease CtpA/Prc